LAWSGRHGKTATHRDIAEQNIVPVGIAGWTNVPAKFVLGASVIPMSVGVIPGPLSW